VPDLTGMTASPGGAGSAADGWTVLHAPAKVNLALHVVGQRADGHHLLESLVTFADAGDRLSLRLLGEEGEENGDRFTLSGPFAPLLGPGDGQGTNLVLRARDLLRIHLRAEGHACGPVHLHLEKNLPVASGIGGGSADAAATLTGLSRMWTGAADHPDLAALGLLLGADLPMCLYGQPLIARGIGEAIEPVPGLPAFPALLVNPGVAVSTPAVFRALTEKTQPPLALPADIVGRSAWIESLSATRNDLEPPARGLAPEIGLVSDRIRASGAAFTRMSGSGATCFGLYLDPATRDAAARDIRASEPGWYLLSCNLRGC
jgi:4-diphosphocytidyl-2-C-methyl-D-erythritol kinase